jgi:hypothetical protein
MGYRFKTPPNWPAPPSADWLPPEGWRPDASWGPAPDGWGFWVEDPGFAGQQFAGSQDAGVAETVLMTLPKTTDVKWGGFMNMYLTDRRLVVEPVLGTGAVMGSVAAGGLVGLHMASKHAQNKWSQEVAGRVRTVDDILASTANAYAIDYGDIAEMVLIRKSLPVGHSRCKIRSTHKNVTLAFKREMFGEASAVLADRLPGRVTIK